MCEHHVYGRVRTVLVSDRFRAWHSEFCRCAERLGRPVCRTCHATLPCRHLSHSADAPEQVAAAAAEELQVCSGGHVFLCARIHDHAQIDLTALLHRVFSRCAHIMIFLDRIFLRIFGIHLHSASIGARALTRSTELDSCDPSFHKCRISHCDDDNRFFGDPACHNISKCPCSGSCLCHCHSVICLCHPLSHVACIQMSNLATDTSRSAAGTEIFSWPLLPQRVHVDTTALMSIGVGCAELESTVVRRY